MAPSPVVAEAPKGAALGEGTTVRRPGRLRVMHPHVAEFLRSPRRHARAKAPAPAQEEEAGAALEEERERARYECAFEDDEDGARGGVAAPPRLVWGKVRHHPWWPGQVFDAADASPLALAHRRPRCGAALVAYFWDKTFAWGDETALRPFRAGFPRLAAQSGASQFVAAVDAALDEVARRVGTGLSCSCGGGKESSACRQVIDNAGVREGAYGAAVDAAFARGALRGEAFVGYISALATAPLAGADRVELTIATAQLKAFSRWRGSSRLPEYNVFHGIDGGAIKAAPGRAKRTRSRRGGDDAYNKWKMSKSRGRDDDDDHDALESEDFPQPAPQQMSTKVGKLMSRAARQMSISPVVLRANGNAPPAAVAKCTRVADGLPLLNNGELMDDPTSGVPRMNKRGPAAEMEDPLQPGLVLNFSSASAVPSTSELTLIFSRFGPVREIRAENAAAQVVFKEGAHAEAAFSGTAKISAISASLVSFRLSYSPPAAPTNPPQSMLDPQRVDLFSIY